MSNRGALKIFKIWIFCIFSYLFFQGIRLKSFLYEMRAIFAESLVHETLFNTVVYGSNETRIIMHNLKT